MSGTPDSPKDTATMPPSRDDGQALYLRLLNEQMLGWDDPRAMLERALAQDQFLLLGQKILSLKSGAADPFCYEVLLRLKQEEANLLPPGGFFPIAESLGLLPDIDRWVVRNVIAWGAAVAKKNPVARLPLLCVNLSGETFEDRSFVAFVNEQLDTSGLPNRSLCFEVSEIDVIDYQRRAREFIAAVRPRCRVTLDAFGSVKVSFAHLAGITVDFIKIDGAVTRQSQGHQRRLPEDGNKNDRRIRRVQGTARQAARDRRGLRAGIRHRAAGADQQGFMNSTAVAFYVHANCPPGRKHA
jgi:EAL domain-containing protein (putative c-di-GMP-specific phosphodiesterase class I)